MVVASGMIIVAYLLGSVPSGLWISNFMRGIDPRLSGSGNIGATNVLRVTGKKEAALTLGLDIFKGYLPVVIAKGLGIEAGGVLLVGFSAIIGHVFPVFLKFKGGKGVAVSLGVFLGIIPKMALISVIVWLGGVFWGKYSSIGALAAFGTLPFLALLLKSSPDFVLFSVAVSVLVCLRHKENINRLLKGEEKRA
jgi:glycerol-3-phosphate acyltransferase PlsY